MDASYEARGRHQRLAKLVDRCDEKSLDSCCQEFRKLCMLLHLVLKSKKSLCCYPLFGLRLPTSENVADHVQWDLACMALAGTNQ